MRVLKPWATVEEVALLEPLFKAPAPLQELTHMLRRDIHARTLATRGQAHV